jgi:hypothetical protein
MKLQSSRGLPFRGFLLCVVAAPSATVAMREAVSEVSLTTNSDALFNGKPQRSTTASPHSGINRSTAHTGSLKLLKMLKFCALNIIYFSYEDVATLCGCPERQISALPCMESNPYNHVS